MPAPPLIVEFVGLPGAGKSTTALRLLERLRNEGRACGDRAAIGGRALDRVQHLRRVAAFNLREPAHIPLALRYGLAVRPVTPAHLRDALKLAAWAYRLEVARAADYELVVLDQGLVQQAWCVVLAGRLRQEKRLHAALRNLLEDAGLAFAYVYVDIPLEVALQRMRERPAKRTCFDRMQRTEALRLLAAHHGHLEQTLSAAMAITEAPCCRLDGCRPVDESAEAVARFVAAWQPGEALAC